MKSFNVLDEGLIKHVAIFLQSLDGLMLSVVIDAYRGPSFGRKCLETHFSIDKGNRQTTDIDRRHGYNGGVGKRPLMSALQTICAGFKRCEPEVIEFLLRFGADVRRQLDVNTKVFWGDADSTVFTAYEGCTAPHMLLDALFYTGEQAEEKRRRCLELMLNEEYTWQTDNRGYSVFHVAAKCGDVEMMRIAVNKAKKSEADYVNLRDYTDGKTALHIAVESHNLPIVKLLVMEGKALISPATEYNQLSVLHHLLKKGNYVNIELRFREEQDVKNIDRAMREMAMFLIQHSTLKDLQQEDRLGCSPLYHACTSGFFEAAALMVQSGAMDYAGSGGSGVHLHANPQKTGSSPAIACLRHAHRLLSGLKGGRGDALPLWESEEPSVRKAVVALSLVETMCVEANKHGRRALAAFAKSLHLGADFQRDELRLPQVEEWPVVQALIEALGGEGRALLSQHL